MAHLDLLSDQQKPKHFSPAKRLYRRVGKRMLDLAISIILLPFLAPLTMALVFLVRLHGGPGLYAHARIGQNGKVFRCWKIRTMVPNSDVLLLDHLAKNATAAEEWGRTQKLQNDPRVTALGRHLRRTSLDELPQIWNVLRGDMSLVGPRPVTPSELARYGLHKNVYLNMRPGVTGLWQVFGRANGCYSQRLEMDRAYQKRFGLWCDLCLIVRTTVVIVRRTGS